MIERMSSGSTDKVQGSPTQIKKLEERSHDVEEDVFEWSGRWQHVLFFIVYIINFDAALSTLENEAEQARSSLKKHNKSFQMLVIAIFIGGPILFFQTSFGQYTRKSCLFLGEMFPCASGLGYSMLLISFYKFVTQIFYCSKLLYYFLITLCNSSPPWMICYESYYKEFPGCISHADIDRCVPKKEKPCFSLGNSTLSAFIFKEAFTFGRIVIGESDSIFRSIKRNQLLLFLFCMINAFIVFSSLVAASEKTTRTFYTALRTGMILCAMILSSILVVVFTQPGVVEALNDLITSNFQRQIFTLSTWISALRKMVETMRLSEGGHILFGSFLPKAKPDFWRSTILTTAYIFLIVLAAIYYHLFLGQLILKLHMNIGALVRSTDENTIFVLFPTSLGMLPSSYFFCLIYFAVLYLLCFFSLSVKVMVIEKSITLNFGLARYYQYVRFTICAVGCLLSISLEKDEVYYVFVESQITLSTCSLIIVTLQLVTLNLFGTARISDDIEFMMRMKVKKVVRFVWLCSPIVFGYAVYVYIRMIDFNTYIAEKITVIAILFSPLLIVLILKIFKFAKKKNLVGLIRATDKYGPPELEERIMRVLYNPRFTVRYKRPVQFCTHDCLLNSNAMDIAIREEFGLIWKFIEELKLEAGNVYTEEAVRAAFLKHVQTLIKYVTKPENSDETAV